MCANWKGLGVALGAGYYLMNPAAAERDSKKIKEESQAYGNKFDSAVDDAMAQAKSYSKDATAELKSTISNVKTKAGDFVDDASSEAKKKYADAQAELSKLKEDTKTEASKAKRGWFS